MSKDEVTGCIVVQVTAVVPIPSPDEVPANNATDKLGAGGSSPRVHG